jgi:hypothetical protein
LAYNENEYGAILLWDIASRSMMAGSPGTKALLRPRLLTDGQTLASAVKTGPPGFGTWPTGRFQFTNPSGGFTSLAFSPDGRTLP